MGRIPLNVYGGYNLLISKQQANSNTSKEVEKIKHKCTFMNKLTLTVSEVKVIHIPPKPLKVRAMKIRTDSSKKNKQVLTVPSGKLTYCYLFQ